MKKFIAIIGLAVLAASMGVAAPDPSPDPRNNINADEIVNRYVSAAESTQSVLRGMQMDVDIEASLPSLKKQGKLHALRSISKLGTVTYHALRFTGDNTIKKDVIARFLTAENQPSKSDMEIVPANYKFKYKGMATRDERQVYLFHISPRHKRVGLFKGDLWIDASTYMPLRESGRFVKNPSILMKKMEFVREFEIRNGVAVPKHIESTVDMRIVGKAELTVNFSNYSMQASDQAKEPNLEPESAPAVTSSDNQ
ncbi:MAG TPA: hypothetical protein VKV15_04120 [Bryobacteraceae bacterium]|nr:hypothetical protein [Bryobacteraceae bacterium]